MSVLASLVRAYERMPDAPPFGYSLERIGFLVSLHHDGTVAAVIDLRGEDRRRSPRRMLVPQGKKRTAGIDPNFLWDKTAYALGVTARESRRTEQEHTAFKARHAAWLADDEDEGLRAFLRFLADWQPESFAPPVWSEEMLDQNIVFALESERREGIFLHDRPAARAAWMRVAAESSRGSGICLVTGAPAPIARLHPSVKGVRGAQSSGASLVSFNLDAFTSYGHEQGENAPVGEAAAFGYTTALNRFLAPQSGHRLQIGDASTVFWADADAAADAAASEQLFAGLLGATDQNAEDEAAASLIKDKLDQIREGRPLAEVEPRLADKGIRFFVLGLSPNAARLAVRFYVEDSFGAITANYQRFLADMRIIPQRHSGPGLWRHLQELAVQRKPENVPPGLAGAWMRAILTGTPYPLTLLSTVLMRIRADGAINALRVGMLKAVLVRNHKREVPVALDPQNRNRGYLLGRLFAVYEEAQRAALGSVNATIRDKFYGAASASPQKVFALLDRGSASHLAKLRKEKPGYEYVLRKEIAAIMEMMDPSGGPIPPSLSAEEQALFAIGYYHEAFRPRGAAAEAGADAMIEPEGDAA